MCAKLSGAWFECVPPWDSSLYPNVSDSLSDQTGVRRKNTKQKITKPVAFKNNNSALNVSSGSNHSMLKLEQILEAVKQDQEKGEPPWCDVKTLKLESDAADVSGAWEGLWQLG